MSQTNTDNKKKKQSSIPAPPRPLLSQSNKTNKKFVEPFNQSLRALLNDPYPLSRQSSAGKSNIVRNPDKYSNIKFFCIKFSKFVLSSTSIIAGSKPSIANKPTSPKSNIQACKLSQEKLLNKEFMDKQYKVYDDCPSCERNGFFVLIEDHYSEKAPSSMDII